MTKPRNDGKDHKLFDELCKAIGLLGEDGKLDISWFGSALS